jgi:hypothetical protein
LLSKPTDSGSRLSAKQTDDLGTGRLESGCGFGRSCRAGRGCSAGRAPRLPAAKTRVRVSSPRRGSRTRRGPHVGDIVWARTRVRRGGAGEDHLDRGRVAVTGAPARRGVLTLCRDPLGDLGQDGNSTRQIQEISFRTIFEPIRASCSRADIFVTRRHSWWSSGSRARIRRRKNRTQPAGLLGHGLLDPAVAAGEAGSTLVAVDPQHRKLMRAVPGPLARRYSLGCAP